MMSIADLVPTTAIVFSIAHSPIADHASRSASRPCSSVMQITLQSRLLSLYLGVIAEYSRGLTDQGEAMNRDAVIVGAVRTPVGKGKANGALHDVLSADLLAHSLREIIARTGVDPAKVDDVIAGAVTQAGDQAANIARNAVLGAGFP